MQSIWPCIQPSSVYSCSSESQTSRPEALSKSHPGGGSFKHTDMRSMWLCTHAHTFRLPLTPSHTHAHNLSPLHSLSLSLTHTHNLISTGIRSFYRAAVCWRGRRYGRAVSPSSDWISDQYPVPHWPASSGRTDCFWKPVLVHVCHVS